MKCKLLFSILLCYCSIATSQIDFEQGYFIDNTGNRVDCLIKNVGWRDNPSQFEYRQEKDGASKILELQDVKEFGVGEYLKYERHRVSLDLSSDVTTALKGGKKPVYEVKTVFLKKLVEAKASLFLYQDGGVKRFLYQDVDSEVIPLVFKRFLVEGGKVGTNTAFRQQLLSFINCLENYERRVIQTDYKESQLVPLFVDYSECESKDAKVYAKPKKKRDFFSMQARIGANHNSFVVGNGSLGQSRGVNGDYGSGISLRYGLEFEFMLPINNGKWSLFFEPFYSKFEVSKSDEITDRELVYSTVEVPIGLRYYFYINSSSRIFLNTSFAFVFNGKSRIQTIRKDLGNFLGEVEINGSEEYVSFGFGYDFKRKISLEFRANTSRDLLGNDYRYNSKYDESFSLILGYRFL